MTKSPESELNRKRMVSIRLPAPVGEGWDRPFYAGQAGLRITPPLGEVITPNFLQRNEDNQRAGVMYIELAFTERKGVLSPATLGSLIVHGTKEVILADAEKVFAACLDPMGDSNPYEVVVNLIENATEDNA